MVPWGEGPAPFERTAEIHCPLMGFFGEEDANPSPAYMRKLDAELTRCGKAHELFVSRREPRVHESPGRPISRAGRPRLLAEGAGVLRKASGIAESRHAEGRSGSEQA